MSITEYTSKKARFLTAEQISTALSRLDSSRYPERDKALFLLSAKAGLRALEIARLTWSMVLTPNGRVGDAIYLESFITKGKRQGRKIPLNQDLRAALQALCTSRGAQVQSDCPVIYSERGVGLSPNSVAHWFLRLYQDLGFTGCSSHSGRRTFVTNAARKIGQVGGSLRDVQQLVGHRQLSTTQRYIDSLEEAQRQVVDLV